MQAKINRKPAETSPRFTDALHDLEPELRQLNGLLTILTLLGETSDTVEPIALSSLGRAAREAFDAINEGWRELMAEAGQK